MSKVAKNYHKDVCHSNSSTKIKNFGKDTLQKHKRMVHKLVGMKVNMAESFKEDKNHFKCKSCGQVFSGPAGKKNLVTHLSKKYKKERFNLR